MAKTYGIPDYKKMYPETGEEVTAGFLADREQKNKTELLTLTIETEVEKMHKIQRESTW